jgi:hypothetical protein
VTERLKVAVLKTAVSIFGTVGSNPTPSGFWTSRGVIFKRGVYHSYESVC